MSEKPQWYGSLDWLLTSWVYVDVHGYLKARIRTGFCCRMDDWKMGMLYLRPVFQVRLPERTSFFGAWSIRFV